MEEIKFSTYCVIPTEVMLSPSISSTAKILYGVISSLTNEKGYCWASNEYLGDLIGISKTRISILIKELVDNDLIETEIKNNYKREIKLKGALRKVKGGVNEKLKGALRKVKDNNINKYYKYNIDTAKPSFAETDNDFSKEIQEVFNLFYEINPTINFGNITQRKSVEELFKKFGVNKTINTIKFAISIQGKKYAPTITTPIELKNNLGKLLIYYKREQEPAKGSMPIFKL